MKKKLITLFLLCSLIVPVGMTGCLDEEDHEPTQETTEAADPAQETTEPREETDPEQPETDPPQDETDPEEEDPTEEVTDPADIDYTTGTPWICSNLDGVVTADTPAELKDDFYLYVNKDAHVALEVPDGATSAGALYDADRQAREDFRNMFAGASPEDHDAKLAYDLYHLATDWESRNAIGAAPLVERADAVEAIGSLDDLTDYLATSGEMPLWSRYFDLDLDKDGYRILLFAPCRLLRGDSAEYAEATEWGEEKLQKYVDFTEQMLVKCGYTEEEAAQKIDNCLAFEAMLAPAVPTDDERYNYIYYQELGQRYSRDEVDALAGDLPLLTELEDTCGIPEMEEYLVVSPEFFTLLGEVYTEENLPLMKDYLIVNLMQDYAKFLDYDTCKLYHEQIDREIDEMPEDAEYGREIAEQQLDWAVQKLYAVTCLSQEDKDRISALTDEIIAKYHDILNDADFISEATRAKAIEKLGCIKKNILFPDDWSAYSYEGLDYASAEDGGTYLDARVQIRDYKLKQAAKYAFEPEAEPQWSEIMDLNEANCFYIPDYNAIYILGGYAQGVFYNADMSTEELYGKLGADIAHEITHAFDISGALYNKDGRLENWWTEEDFAAFMERNNKMIDYYNTKIQPWEGQALDGEVLAGETCADMGSVKCMLLMAADIPDFDYDTFFRAYAEERLTEHTTDFIPFMLCDPHPIDYLRVNMVLQQFDEFLDFYGISEGDGMYLAPEDRILIW